MIRPRRLDEACPLCGAAKGDGCEDTRYKPANPRRWPRRSWDGSTRPKLKGTHRIIIRRADPPT